MSEPWWARRTPWLWLQHGVGVLNAFAMIGDLDAGRPYFAAFSAFCVLVTASWKIPPPTKD